jgi:hypothetical protein
VAEIGSTWLASSAQRSGSNTESKLLMLSHAFDSWGVLRVTLKTDSRNARSRRAIERIGARFEGIRRAHARAVDGSVRDTAYYSIIRPEWPGVRAALTARLTALSCVRPAKLWISPRGCVKPLHDRPKRPFIPAPLWKAEQKSASFPQESLGGAARGCAHPGPDCPGRRMDS